MAEVTSSRAAGERWGHLSELLIALTQAETCGAALASAVDALAAAFPGAAVEVRESGGAPRGLRCLSVPLSSRAGLVLRAERAEPFEEGDDLLVAAAARALDVALERITAADTERSLRRSLTHQRMLLDHLGRIERAIVDRVPLSEVLQDVCEAAAALLGDEVSALRLVDPDDQGAMVMVAEVGVPETALLASRTPVSEGISGRAVADGELVISDDYRRSDAARAPLLAGGITSAMSAPVFGGGRVIGALTVATGRPRGPYTEEERAVLVALAAHAGLALNDARTLDALHATLRDALRAATHDPLTNLPNRAILFQHLDEAIRLRRPGASVSVLVVDLDRFKAVNDSLGHDTGDEVLREVATRLRRSVRPTDLVARLAGDEFVVVCPGLHGEIDAIGLADRIANELSRPIAAGGHDVIVTCSVGISHGDGDDIAGDQLLRDADMAMYRAKERGADRIEVFGGSLRSAVRARLDVEHALRGALGRGELRLEYQPVVDPHGRTTTVEALLRWDHADRPTSPAEFIPIAEETGLIVPIGAWVLRTACAQIASWRRSEPSLSDVRAAVNVSMRQFAHDDFVTSVADTLAATGLDPAALCLEVTESMLLDDVSHAVRTLLGLKDLGVAIAIDDFGTGYSSLANLRRFPVDVLKIDRSFVEHLASEPEESAILAAVAELGRALGVAIVAEGVETEAQLAELQRLGITSWQGYLFSRPKPAEDLLGWLRDRAPAALAG
ncbi:MAG TPA: EAL domain-containing protein [Acidimicrobiales bacterium]|nr:EAL domain-containing protein [Acidimicrobiales bacterium]